MSTLKPGLRRVHLLGPAMVVLLLLSVFHPGVSRAAGDEGLKAAKGEGGLVWYTSMRITDSRRVLKKFEAKYPFVRTELYRATGERVLNKILTEARAGRFVWDAIGLTLFEVEHIKTKGWLLKHGSPENKFFSKEYVDPDGYWTDIYDNTLVIAYNVNMVRKEELPRTWEDLLHQRWKGKFLLDDEEYEWFAIMMKVMGEERGVKYMRRLSNNEPQLRSGHTLITTSVAAGEFPIGLTYGHQVEQFKEKGAPMDWVAMEFVPVYPHPVAIGKNAPHPNVAKLFYDFTISEEGQKLIRSFHRIPPRIGVEPDPPRLTKGLKLAPSTPELAPKYGKYVKMFQEIFRK